MKISFKTILTYTLILFCSSSSFAQENIKQPFLYKSISQGFLENKGQINNQNDIPNSAVAFLWSGQGLNVQLRKTGFSYDVWKKEKTTATGNSFSKSITAKQDIYPSMKESNINYTYTFNRIDIEFENATNNIFIFPEEASSDYTNYYTAGTSEQGVSMVKNYKKVTYKNVWKGIDIEFELIENKPKYNIIVRPGAKLTDIKLRINGADKIDEIHNGLLLKTSIAAINETIPYSFTTKGNKNQNILTHFMKLDKNLFTIITHETIPEDAILTIDPTPTLVWSTYYGGGGANEYSVGITTDKNENVIITGRANSSSQIATSGAYSSTLNGKIDAFIVKFNSSGARQWGTYFGGSEDDYGDGISNDTLGNLYVVGKTQSSSGVSTSGAHQTSFGGGTDDGFIAKFDKSGSRIWSTYYGGTSYGEGCIGIAVSQNNFLVVTGITTSSNGIATSGAHQTSFGGSYDGFIVKFNLSGKRLWGTYYGGSSDDYGMGLSVGSNGFIYLSGGTNSTSGIASSGAYQSTFGGVGDGFLVKFDTSGTRVWGTYYGGSKDEFLFGVKEQDSIVYIGGSTRSSSGIATSGAFQTSLKGSRDGFFAKFNSSGSRIMGTYFGGNDDDFASSIFVDKFGSVYLSGTTSSSGMATGGAFDTALTGSVDGFVAKFNKSTGRVWATYFGGDAVDQIFGSASTFSGNLYITGVTRSSTSFPISSGAHQSTLGGSEDAFVSSIMVDSLLIKNNNINNSQNICSGKAPMVISGSSPSGGGGNGTYTYRWLKSTSGNRSDYTLASGSANGINYYPPTLNSTTWYKRVVVSGKLRDTSNAVMITVFPKPKVGFTINNNAQCLSGNIFIFTDTSSIQSGKISIRLWTFGNGKSDTASNPTKSYDSSKNYNVKLVLTSNYGCKDSLTKQVSVYFQPKTKFGINNNAQCLKGNVFLFYDSSGIKSGTLKQVWDFGDSTNSVANPGVKIYKKANTFRVKLTSTSDYGCMDTLSKSIIVNSQPGANISSPSGIQDICQKDSLELKANTGSSLSYKWLKNDTAIINSNLTKILVKKTGRYKVMVTNTALCSDTSENYQVTVFPIPVVGNISGSKVITNFSPVNYSITPQLGSNYLWSITSGSITSGQSTNSILVQWTKNKTGKVKVKLTNSGNCSDTSVIDINIIVSIKNNFSDNAIRLYPNPNKGKLTIEIDNPAKDVSIEVYDMLGKQVEKLERVEKVTLIDLKVDAGIYMVRVTNGGVVWNQKVSTYE